MFSACPQWVISCAWFWRHCNKDQLGGTQQRCTEAQSNGGVMTMMMEGSRWIQRYSDVHRGLCTGLDTGVEKKKDTRAPLGFHLHRIEPYYTKEVY